MLFLILCSSFLFGVLIPGSDSLVVSVMAAYLFFVAGANCGAIILSELGDGIRHPHLRIAAVGLFILPPLAVTLIEIFR